MELDEFEKALRSPLSSEQIKNYNQQPEVKEKGVKLVSEKEDEKREIKDKTKTILLIILGVAVLCFCVLTYLAYNGNLKIMDFTCPQPQQITIPPCPASPDVVVPACPSCPSTNFTCNPLIKIYTNSS